MDVLEAIKKRRSIRKYLDVGVEWEKMIKILEAGQYSPSAGNLQDWKFIVVTEKDVKKKIAEACLNQVWMETAPVHMVVCSNPEKTIQYYGERGEKYAAEDTACVAMNMLLEATEQGLDSCWIGAFDEQMLRISLGIPDRAKPMMVITLGYADETVPTPPRVPRTSTFRAWGRADRPGWTRLSWYRYSSLELNCRCPLRKSRRSSRHAVSTMR